MNQSPVAIVTGAGSGIGRATAEALAALGYALVLAGRTEAALETTRAALGTAAHAIIVPTDMGIESEVHRLIDRAAESFGRVDVLVNNAGTGRHIGIERTTPALARELMQVNALGPALAVLRAWPIFTAQKSGCVVNVSSMATIDPFPGFFAYAASKAPMNLMVDSIAKEGAAIGVRAYSVAPGAVETPLLRANFDEAMIPRSMCLTPGEVARVIVECVRGARPDANGGTIAMFRDAQGVRAWTLPRVNLDRGFETPHPAAAPPGSRG